MDIRYEMFVDNVVEGGFQVWSLARGFTTIAGGDQTISDSPYTYLQNPNAIPAVNTDPLTRKGLALDTDSRGRTIYGTAWASLSLAHDRIRCFFQKLQVRVGWSADGTATLATPLVGRWVGGGAQEWDAYYLQNIVSRPQSWAFGTDYWEATQGQSVNRSDHAYTLTDDSGIATYYALCGIALHDPVAGTWQLESPPTGNADRGAQNAGFVLNNRETHYLSQNDGTLDYLRTPYQVGESYYLRQCARDDLSADGGHGWRTDPSTGWDAATGILTVTPGSRVDFVYTQGMVFRGLPVGTTVSFGAGAFTGTAGAGDLTVYAMPRGSLLDNLRATAADLAAPSQAPSVDVLPLRDASDYPATSATLGADGQPVAPQVTIPTGISSATGPVLAVSEPLHSHVTYTGKSGATLTGVALADTHPVGPYYGEAQFEGGEVVTLPYDDLTITFPSGGGTQQGRVVIFEDSLPPFATTAPVDTTVDGSGLDVARDPFGEPCWVEGREPEVWQWVGSEMERAFLSGRILSETLKSPSQVVLPDHRRILLGIVSGDARAWTTDDSWDTDRTGTSARVANARTYTKGVLREGPDEALHAWLSTADGLVDHVVSLDGGETWGDPVTVSDLPAQRDERGDARHNGETWLRLHPEGTDGVTLYQSFDGEAWESQGAVASTGSDPWLMVLPDGRLACLVYDSTAIVCRTATDASGAWVWSDPATVGVVDPTGPVGWANGQKILVGARSGKSGLSFFRSFDAGETWESGSEG